MAQIRLPAGFLWGTAPASCQIEGSPLADGASPSIWHELARRRGRIREWELGTSMRFGLVRTDVTTLERTWKRSASWHSDLARAKALDIGDAAEPHGT